MKKNYKDTTTMDIRSFTNTSNNKKDNDIKAKNSNYIIFN